MLRNWRFYLCSGLGLLLLSWLWPLSVQAGGWAVLTVESLPTEVVAERPFNITFVVRQHGTHLLGGLQPTVTAVRAETGQTFTFDALNSDTDGYYAAELLLPYSGEWQWVIDAFGYEHVMPSLMVSTAGEIVPARSSGSLWATTWWSLSALGLLGMAVALYAWRQNHSRTRLGLALVALIVSLIPFAFRSGESETAVAQQTAVPAIASENMGHALFVSKGCVTCHQHDAVTIAPNFATIGPNLSHYPDNPDFLKQWLSEPTAVKPDTLMPNLALSDTEIQTLIAFLADN